jgi:malate dehydrogenase (oxaloacetate-decarboxylating)(NADP+)
VIYADGEDERVLRAVQSVLEENIAKPILIGRPDVIETRLKRYGLSLRSGVDFDFINPADDPRYRDYVATYVAAAGRRGISPDSAKLIVRTSPTVIAALAVKRGDADAMLCGLEGRFKSRAKYIKDILGLVQGATDFAAMTLMITNKGAFFIADTHIRYEPTAAEIAEMTLMCAEQVRHFGLVPKIALVSHSDFGSEDTDSALKMRAALAILQTAAPDLEVDGEMQADSALSQTMRDIVLPASRLKGEANVLIMPNLDSANAAYQIMKIMADALPVGPILIGAAQPAHILTPSVTARGIVNMTAFAVAEAQSIAARREKDPAHLISI